MYHTAHTLLNRATVKSSRPMGSNFWMPMIRPLLYLFWFYRHDKIRRG